MKFILHLTNCSCILFLAYGFKLGYIGKYDKEERAVSKHRISQLNNIVSQNIAFAVSRARIFSMRNLPAFNGHVLSGFVSIIADHKSNLSASFPRLSVIMTS